MTSRSEQRPQLLYSASTEVTPLVLPSPTSPPSAAPASLAASAPPLSPVPATPTLSPTPTLPSPPSSVPLIPTAVSSSSSHPLVRGSSLPPPASIPLIPKSVSSSAHPLVRGSSMPPLATVPLIPTSVSSSNHPLVRGSSLPPPASVPLVPTSASSASTLTRGVSLPPKLLEESVTSSTIPDGGEEKRKASGAVVGGRTEGGVVGGGKEATQDGKAGEGSSGEAGEGGVAGEVTGTTTAGDAAGVVDGGAKGGSKLLGKSPVGVAVTAVPQAGSPKGEPPSTENLTGDLPVPPPVESHRFHAEDGKDASFVLSALVAAVEEGNLAGLEKLFSVAQNIDVNMANKHGESVVHLAAGLGEMDALELLVKKGGSVDAMDAQGDTPLHWASRQGHANIIGFLIQQGAQINSQNKNGESCLHVACRYGHTSVVQTLCMSNMNIDLQDDHGESALHIAVWHGFPRIVHHLCSAAANTSLVEKEGQMPLHVASLRGHVECVRGLLGAGAEVDAQDLHGSTPLHLALARHHSQVALLLLHAGANTDITDDVGESPIHIVAREGLLALAQTLCAFGCCVDVSNKTGLYPIHLAAKHGHTEVVRCLCLAGCAVEQKSRDGILAEVTAMAQGYDDIADLLNKLRNEHQREEYIQQLIPTAAVIPRIKVKILGHSGSGKSALVESLKAGYFSSLFRRSKSSSSNVSLTSSCKSQNNLKGHFEMESPASSRQNSLTFDPCDMYTKGIDVQQVNISGVGELSVWEFSGHEAYFPVYDHFIGNTSCAHLLLFPLNQPYDVQLQQCSFWLSFLQARIPPMEPLGTRGKPSKAAKVALVGTHADVAQCHRNAQGDYLAPQVQLLQEKLVDLFGDIFDIHDTVYVMDATAPGSPALKALKQYLADIKAKVTQGWSGSSSVSYAVGSTVCGGDGYTILQPHPCEGLPNVTGFLTSVVQWIREWRTSLVPFPVVSWPQFVDVIHQRVNPLAGEEHMRELVQQLQLMGEVVYLKCEVQDLVVLDPHWLCSEQIGQLLSTEYFTQAKVTGCYTVDDFQMSFPVCDALDLLQVLEALHLCTQCDNDGEIEYEFPCFNQIETLEGLWEQSDTRYTSGAYGGVRLRSPAPTQHLLPPLYTRIQVQLRRSWQEYPERDTDLYQWCGGSKFCSGPLEALITLEEEGEAIEVKVRGPPQSGAVLFFFMEDLLAIIDQVLVEMCPGLVLEKHILSSSQLSNHSPTVFAWTPSSVYSSLLADGMAASLHNPITNTSEAFMQLVCFGAQDVASSLIVGGDIHVSSLCTVTIQKLASLMDPPHPRGSDWCVLAVKLGLQNLLPSLDIQAQGNNSASSSSSSSSSSQRSSTASLLHAWGQSSTATIGTLMQQLRAIEREDAAVAVMCGAPLYQLSTNEEDATCDTPPISSTSATSTSNLSR
ncbi:death-associated protein kinase dapk-1-like isoform X4 [Oratosquilla oratoria]|uniref:death-associated protein kinase dapk-1-like isoform X4 n=1 Tax=Oratosquilla oratoria TaxID=337810 RepID=UPI003F77559A